LSETLTLRYRLSGLIPTLYLSFFEFVHNVKKRGKRLLSSLLETLLKKTLESI
jgi:hypothetical protein